MTHLKTSLIFFTLLLLNGSLVFAEDADSSPLSAGTLILEGSDDTGKLLSDFTRSLNNPNILDQEKPLIFKLGRVTDPSTINPGNPMPVPDIDGGIKHSLLHAATSTTIAPTFPVPERIVAGVLHEFVVVQPTSIR